MREAAIEIPAALRYVPVDFESVSLTQGLERAGFDARQPAYFTWLGVTMYLEEAAILQTLRFVASCAPGSAVLFEFVVPLEELPAMMRMAMEQVTGQLARNGEPWKSYFNAAALDRTLASLGFSRNTLWTPDDLNRRYLADRTDGLHIGAGPGRLMLATV